MIQTLPLGFMRVIIYFCNLFNEEASWGLEAIPIFLGFSLVSSFFDGVSRKSHKKDQSLLIFIAC